MGCWRIWCGWRWGEGGSEFKSISIARTEERFLSPQADRFTLTRASQNQLEKQKRRLVLFEMTVVLFCTKREVKKF